MVWASSFFFIFYLFFIIYFSENSTLRDVFNQLSNKAKFIIVLEQQL